MGDYEKCADCKEPFNGRPMWYTFACADPSCCRKIVCGNGCKLKCPSCEKIVCGFGLNNSLVKCAFCENIFEVHCEWFGLSKQEYDRRYNDGSDDWRDYVNKTHKFCACGSTKTFRKLGCCYDCYRAKIFLMLRVYLSRDMVRLIIQYVERGRWCK